MLVNMLACEETLYGATPDCEGAIGFLRRVGVWGFDDPHGGRWRDRDRCPRQRAGQTARLLDGKKPTPTGPNTVRNRTMVQQYSVNARDDVFQGTPPLNVIRLFLSQATAS